MKKLLLLFFLCFLNYLYAVPFEGRIISSEDIELKKVYPEFENSGSYKGEISYVQMQEDLVHLNYLLYTCYAGYEDMISRGFDFENAAFVIEKKFSGQEVIQSRDFAKAIYEELKDYINDTHFCIYLGNFFPEQALIFSKHSNIYFTDRFVEENEKSNYPEELLFSYFYDGKLKYRLGQLSETPIEKVQGIEARNFPVDRPRAIPYYKEKETSQAVYVRLESFMGSGKGAEITFDKFVTLGKRHLDKNFVIVDLRTNQGGVPGYVYSFAENFYYDKRNIKNKKTENLVQYSFSKKVEEMYDGCFLLYSPGILQWNYESLVNSENSKAFIDETKALYDYFQNKAQLVHVQYRNYETKEINALYKKNVEPIKSEGAFKGKFIVILDRNSCSASEELARTLIYLFGKDQVIVIGENSGGCLEYAGLRDYNLPNSSLTLHVAANSLAQMMRRLDSWHGEGKGIYPDIWSTDEDLSETLWCLTKDPKVKELF